MSTKETLSYIDENGGDVDGTVFDPGTSVTVDGVPNDATGLDDIDDDNNNGNVEIGATEIEWSNDRAERANEIETALREEVQFGDVEGENPQKPVPLPDGEESRQDWLDTTPKNVAEALARSKDPEVAVQTIDALSALGNDGAGSHGSANWLSGSENSNRMKLTSLSESTGAHETGHAMHKSFGGTGNKGTSAIDYNRQIPNYDWDNPEDALMTYTLDDPERSISNSDLENFSFGVSEWRDRVDSEVGPELTGRNFTEPPEDWFRDELEEGKMVRFADYPTQQFDEDGPTAWRVEAIDDDVVTLESPKGETFEAEVNESRFGPDTLDAVNITETNGLTPDVVGKRESTPDSWGLDNPDPDEIIGELDRPDDVQGRMDEIHKEANAAWYKQHKLNNVYGEDTAGESHIISAYSSTTAHEVLAQMHEVMSNDKIESRKEAAAHSLVKYHPRLLERYRQQFEITGDMREKINTELKIQRKDARI
jgi:hypothetical protein